MVVPAGSFTPPSGSPLALREHPRLLVSAASLPALKAKLGSGGVWASDFRTWVAWADSQYASHGSVDGRHLPEYVATYALIWLTHPVAGVSYGKSRAEYGTAARNMLMRVPTAHTEVNIAHFPVALAYDWIYPLLTSTDKLTLAAFFRTIDLQSLVKVGADPFNSQVALARVMKTIGALAIARDGVDDAWADATLNRYEEFFSSTTGVTRSDSDLGGDDGTFSQGNTYALDYTYMHVVVSEEAWRTANAFSAAAFYSAPERAVLRRLPQYFADSVLPWGAPSSSSPGGRRYVLAKTQRSAANLGAADNYFGALMTAYTGVLKAADPQMSGLAQWLRDNRVGEARGGDVQMWTAWAVYKFVLGDKAPPVDPVAAGLKLSRAGRDGRFVFRTGWTNPADSYVTFRANRWARNGDGMSPNAPGGFTIDRNGPQVIFQGGNDGHDWGSSSGAGPANTLIFIDPTQTAPTGSYDDFGGHRMLPGVAQGSVDFVPGGPLDARDALRFLAASGAARDVDYVSADVTRSYNSSRYTDGRNPARVSDVVRQLVYFRPATPGVDADRVIVFDRTTTTNTRFEKRWLFHTSGEPSVNGSVTVGRPIRAGSGAGKWTYTGATRVTATNTVNGSNGRTFLTPLLPSSRTIVKVGGPNGSGTPWRPDSHEYEDALGLTHEANTPRDADTAQYVGSYRVEVIPSTPALTDVFLNVVEVTDSSASAPSATVLLSGTGLVAARVGNRIAAFNRVSADVTTGDFTVDAAGSYGVHIADLTPGREYEVTVGGGVTTVAASSAGTIYLQQSLAAGTRIALRATGVVVTTAPAPPANVRIVP